MNKFKPHTRNQRRMYRIHEQEERIYDLELVVGSLQRENKKLKEQLGKYKIELEKADSITQSCIFDGKRDSEISFRKCLNELETYKKLYQNEKDHTDTLKRIIKKIEENLQELYIANDDKSYDLYKNILDLLKEIK